MLIKIIAEIGVNYAHQGEVFELLDQLSVIGIKFAKMQMFTADMVHEELSDRVLDYDTALLFFNYARNLGIELFFSVMYPEAIKDLEKIGVHYYKLRFHDQNNLILYRKLKKIKKPIFISTFNPGSCIWKNIALYQERVHYLFCIPAYPSRLGLYTHVLDKMQSPKQPYSGISDHTKSTELLKRALDGEFKWCEWFELHVALNDDAYEIKWSKTISELKKVLKDGKD